MDSELFNLQIFGLIKLDRIMGITVNSGRTQTTDGIEITKTFFPHSRQAEKTGSCSKELIFGIRGNIYVVMLLEMTVKYPHYSLFL